MMLLFEDNEKIDLKESGFYVRRETTSSLYNETRPKRQNVGPRKKERGEELERQQARFLERTLELDTEE